MHKITFYPVGNGDCSQIVLENDKRILMDYRQHSKGTTNNAPEIDLKTQLLSELKGAGRSSFDVVAFTHGDNDHIAGSTEFFYLDHASKYQSEDRIKIDEIWVPAAMILETASADELDQEYIILRSEARHRLVQGYGIKVFSRPSEIDDFLRGKDIKPEDRDQFFVNAGEIVNTFSLAKDGVEFFCHSPFKEHTEESNDLKAYRNATALIFNVRFQVDSAIVDYFATGDSEHQIVDQIVSTTEYYGNDDRLEWDLFSLPHHCSYLSVGPDKGEKKTQASEGVEKLLDKGRRNAYIVSSSRPIKHDKEAYEQIQPPHVQAKNRYLEALEEMHGRRFVVTMEEPNETKPQPLVFEIGSGGLSWVKAVAGGSAAVASADLRAGKA